MWISYAIDTHGIKMSPYKTQPAKHLYLSYRINADVTADDQANC